MYFLLDRETQRYCEVNNAGVRQDGRNFQSLRALAMTYVPAGEGGLTMRSYIYLPCNRWLPEFYGNTLDSRLQKSPCLILKYFAADLEVGRQLSWPWTAGEAATIPTHPFTLDGTTVRCPARLLNAVLRLAPAARAHPAAQAARGRPAVRGRAVPPASRGRAGAARAPSVPRGRPAKRARRGSLSGGDGGRADSPVGEGGRADSPAGARGRARGRAVPAGAGGRARGRAVSVGGRWREGLARGRGGGRGVARAGASSAAGGAEIGRAHV
jgi:hypothetical protein